MKMMNWSRIKEYLFPSVKDNIAELIAIIKIVRQKITDDSDIVWTTYESAQNFREELDRYIQQLESNDISCIKKLHILFLPTGNFQEHSLSNGWAQEYLKLSARFDVLHARLEKNSK